MGIAAVIGCPDALCGIQPGDAVIVDGKKGLAITNPSETIVREYKEKLFDQKLRQDLSDMNKFKRLRALLRASVFGNLRVMDAIGRVKSLLLLRNDIYEA
jgi:phosphoenolpyruvate-protein kinase (PTS system EI component)